MVGIGMVARERAQVWQGGLSVQRDALAARRSLVSIGGYGLAWNSPGLDAAKKRSGLPVPENGNWWLAGTGLQSVQKALHCCASNLANRRGVNNILNENHSQLVF
jgi:hypothetical protein